MFIAHVAHHAQRRDAVHIEYGFGLRVVTGLHAIATQAQDIAHAHRRSTEDVALHGDAISVAAGLLQDHGVAASRQQ